MVRKINRFASDRTIYHDVCCERYVQCRLKYIEAREKLKKERKKETVT